MNERLENEIMSWLKEGNITDTRLDDYDDKDIVNTARHFYNLALEDIRSELKRRYKERDEWLRSKEGSDLQDRTWTNLNAEDESIIRFISGLKNSKQQ